MVNDSFGWREGGKGGALAGGGGRGRARTALFQAAADSSRSGMMPDPEPSLAFILNLRGDTSACPSPATITTLAPPHPPHPSCRAPINRHAVHVAAVHLVIKSPSDPSLGGVGKGPDVDLAYAWPRGRRLLTSPSIPSLSPLLFPLFFFFPSSHYTAGLRSGGSLELTGGREGSV